MSYKALRKILDLRRDSETNQRHTHFRFRDADQCVGPLNSDMNSVSHCYVRTRNECYSIFDILSGCWRKASNELNNVRLQPHTNPQVALAIGIFINSKLIN
jgi:hypothetical protein